MAGRDTEVFVFRRRCRFLARFGIRYSAPVNNAAGSKYKQHCQTDDDLPCYGIGYFADKCDHSCSIGCQQPEV